MNEHLHEVREPGPGELSYRGMGEWMMLPIPRSWRVALERAIAEAPGLAQCQSIRELMSCDVVDDGMSGKIDPGPELAAAKRLGRE